MQVTISVNGRFHAFDIARQLIKRGYFKKIITSYPYSEVRKYGIPKSATKSIIITEILKRGYNRLPRRLRALGEPQFFICELFDKMASKRLPASDIFIGWSSNSLHSLRVAKREGAITLLERGSPHILYREQILRDECDRFGLTHKGSMPGIIKKELQEYEEADYIEVPSSFAKRTFLTHNVNANKIIQSFRGIYPLTFRQVAKEDTMFRLLYVGRIALAKGLHYLLRAFSELDLPNSELLLIGPITDVELKSFLRRYDKKVKWLGAKPQRELYKYYSQGSVFVLNSIEEGFPMVLTQAMSCGLPIICTVNTAGPDIIEDNNDGFIIPIRDIDALKEKILFFYRNPKKCCEMGQAAKQKAHRSFTWDHYGEKMIHIYKQLLACKKRTQEEYGK
jgi:glycosyltransferase involved in cell wall biosynthesis